MKYIYQKNIYKESMHRSVALQKIKVILNLLFRFPNGFVSGSMFHHAFFFGFTKREEE